MYIRKTNSGHEIKWEPENIELGKQAMSEVLNVPIEEIDKEKFVLVTNEQARQIQKRYQELTEQIDE